MSDAWAMNAGKASTAIGTATITAVDDTFTLTAHGLGNGDIVTVDTLTGGAVGVLVADAVYFVRDATTDTFTLSLTVNGPVVQFASDGGADVYSFAPQYTAAELRRLSGSLVTDGLAAGQTAGGFSIRHGVFPHSFSGQVIDTVASGTWTTRDFTGVLHPALTSVSGGYLVQHPADTGAYDPADGANPRIDALDLQIQDDDEDFSGFRRVRLVYVSGSPAATPDAPALTTNALRLGTWQVNVGGSITNITHTAPITVARGGVIPIRDSTELPASGRHEGLLVWNMETDELIANLDGAGSFATVATPGGWFPIGSGRSVNAASVDIDLTGGGRWPAGTFTSFRLRAWGRMDATGTIGGRVNGLTTTYRRAMTRIDAGDDSIDGDSDQAGSAWVIGPWGVTQHSYMEFAMSEDGSRVGTQWQTSGVDVPTVAFGGGSNDNSLTPDELTFFVTSPGTATEFTIFNWEVEGYIP